MLSQSASNSDIFALDRQRVIVRHRPCGVAGFTLIETLVAMGVFALLMALVVTCILLSVRAVQNGEQRVSVYQMGKTLIAKLEREIRGARIVVVDAGGASLVYRSCAGEDIAYVYDAEAMTLRRIVRDCGDRTGELVTDVFPSKYCVESCAFRLNGGRASMSMAIVDRDKHQAGCVTDKDRAVLSGSATLRAVVQ